MTINSNVNKLTTWQETPIADSPFCRNPITVPPIQAAQFSPGVAFSNSQQATSLLQKEGSSQKQSALNARQPRPKPPRPKPTRCYGLPNFLLGEAFLAPNKQLLFSKKKVAHKSEAHRSRSSRGRSNRGRSRGAATVGSTQMGDNFQRGMQRAAWQFLKPSPKI